jgi:2-dehydro-3-deoxyphosphogluconate aldolase/(4S)-4-hydroxy-2-oxoglutarate aldolase
MDEKIRMIRRIIMNKVLEEISKIGIVPVIALDHVEDAAPLAKALCDGGLPCAEVTFRTAAAEESIRIMAEQFPEMLVGAGTVLTTEQVDRAVNAGAKFIVSPGLNPKVVKYCVEKGIPVTPGCSNPSDVEVAIELGLDVVKFFPAEAAGGLNMIKSMAAPYVNMKFMPTGGINAKNLTNYLDFNKIIACGGSWMVSKDLVAAKDWTGITALTKEAVSTMLGFKLLHVGVNNASEEAAASDSAKFATLLGQDVKVGNSSMFVGSLIEMMKNPGRGTCGHIAIQTNYLARAMYHLEKRGFVFDESSFKYDAKGNITVAYLKDEIAGFAVHFNQK